MNEKKIRYFVICAAFWIAGLLPIGARVYAESRETYINEEYVEYAEEIGKQYNIAPELIISMIEAESSGRWNIISEDGAIGLMQIVPKYHTD